MKTKDEAIAKAGKLGYSIRYFTSNDECRFRKPGSPVNAHGNPHQFAKVWRVRRTWHMTEEMDPLWDL